MSTRIDLSSLLKTFRTPGGGLTAAVDGVSLTVEPGELFFLLGPSGCGKTTLLRMIAGFIDPSGGVISFTTPEGRRDVTHLAPNKRNTGMVFQSYALWPHMTVAQNVAFGLTVRKVSAEERDRRVREALADVQMEGYADRKPTQLSGGQQQRVALARALVVRPDVLLLDEPLSNLDAKLRIELRSQIRSICKSSGITTVYVTHDQKEALSMADRVAIMRSGKVQQLGTPDELYRRPATRFVASFLGETNFLSGEVTGADGEFVSVDTGAGVIRALVGSMGRARGGDGGGGVVSLGERVTCSVRPEALSLRVVEGKGGVGGGGGGGVGGALTGRVVGTVYLGEIAQHTVELLATDASTDAMRVHVSELNPRGRGVVVDGGGDEGEDGRDGGLCTLAVSPRDVVIVGE